MDRRAQDIKSEVNSCSSDRDTWEFSAQCSLLFLEECGSIGQGLAHLLATEGRARTPQNKKESSRWVSPVGQACVCGADVLVKLHNSHQALPVFRTLSKHHYQPPFQIRLWTDTCQLWVFQGHSSPRPVLVSLVELLRLLSPPCPLWFALASPCSGSRESHI